MARHKAEGPQRRNLLLLLIRMKAHHVLLACLVSAALWDDRASFTIHRKREGGTFRIRWFFNSPTSLKFLCRRECTEGDVLVETEQNAAQGGRYSTDYTNGTSGGGHLAVTIANLTKSDSGRYRFGLGRPLAPDSSRDFEIRVLDAREEEFNVHSAGEGGSVSVLCRFFSPKSAKFFCRNACEDGDVLLQTTADRARSGRYGATYQQVGAKFTLRVTIANLSRSDSGLYACGSGESASSASLQKFEIRVADDSSRPASVPLASAARSSSSSPEGFPLAATEATDRSPGSARVAPPAYFLPLVICMPVVVALLAIVLLFLYRLKTKKNSESRNMQVTLLAVTYEHDVSFHSHPDECTVQEPETF